MKKLSAITLCSLFVASAILSSCHQPTHCQAYSKAVKVKADRTEKSI